MTGWLATCVAFCARGVDHTVELCVGNTGVACKTVRIVTGVTAGANVVLSMVRCRGVVIVVLMASYADFFVGKSVCSGGAGVAVVTAKTSVTAHNIRAVP